MSELQLRLEPDPADPTTWTADYCRGVIDGVRRIIDNGWGCGPESTKMLLHAAEQLHALAVGRG